MFFKLFYFLLISSSVLNLGYSFRTVQRSYGEIRILRMESSDSSSITTLPAIIPLQRIPGGLGYWKPEGMEVEPLESGVFEGLQNKLDSNINKFTNEPISKLLNDISNNQVEQIYFSSDLKQIFSKEMESNNYKFTNSNPLLANNIIELSTKNNVNTVILSEPSFSFNNIAGFVGGSIDNLFTFIIISSIVRGIFFYIQNNGKSNNSQNNLIFNPFSQFQPNNFNVDKENMIKTNISLSSWAGSPEIFLECTEVISYLQNSTIYAEAGAELPRGILLEGPPGTGKTLLAKAIASETNANFISTSGSEFIELFVGGGALKVRNLFKKARENAPSIIFIDEIDSIGRQRGVGINMGNDEREQTLNQLLAEMDGFALNDNVLVIAATNRKDILDSALLRPGRFDRIINVPLPDRDSRKKIIESYLNAKKFDKENMNLAFLSELTAGFSGAQLKNIINEAAIYAAREGRSIIIQNDIENALEKIIIGITKKIDNRSDSAKLRVAIHEIGHAIMAAQFKEYFELKKVSIESTYNGIGGYTIFSEYPEIIDSGLYTKDLLKKRIKIALGGKAAEFVFYGEEFVSVGAIQDLKQANSLAQKMIGNYGMGKDLEVFYNENIDSENSYFGKSADGKYSEKTKELIDNEVLNIINKAYLETLNYLTNNKENIEALAIILVENRTLNSNVIYDKIK